LIIHPIDALLHRTPLVFVIVDWSTGAMALRVLYNLVLMDPLNETTILITQSLQAGLQNMNLTKLTHKIFLPIISTTTLLLSLPFLGHCVELLFNLDKDLIQNYIKSYALLVVLGIYICVTLFGKVVHGLRYWFEHLKDDRFLIGRTLENVASD
jgi:hypothetical protein